MCYKCLLRKPTCLAEHHNIYTADLFGSILCYPNYQNTVWELWAGRLLSLFFFSFLFFARCTLGPLFSHCPQIWLIRKCGYLWCCIGSFRWRVQYIDARTKSFQAELYFYYIIKIISIHPLSAAALICIRPCHLSYCSNFWAMKNEHRPCPTFFHSHWAFSFHWSMNSSLMIPWIERICNFQRITSVCLWLTGLSQSSCWLIEDEWGSGWIKDWLIKMSREHAGTLLIYCLKLSWGETERWDEIEGCKRRSA